jgi:XcyI restriction endonuclease
MWLIDALSDALGRVDPNLLKIQLSTHVPADAQPILAAADVRDEHVFPTALVLEAKLTLVGYYRILLGVSQKSFYGTGTGMGRFSRMEARGVLTDLQREALPECCRAMSEALAESMRQMSPTVTPRDVAELPLLTLGGQFQGSNNDTIGKRATVDVFLSIGEIVKDCISKREDRRLTVRNASNRTVVIALASDPDVRIQEEFGSNPRNKVAIEIKGGTDKSNAHNRAGEAEKSHQKAKREGLPDFWTIIVIKGLDLNKLRSESPTTNSWFDVARVLGRNGEDWEEFRSRLAGEIGIPLI